MIAGYVRYMIAGCEIYMTAGCKMSERYDFDFSLSPAPFRSIGPGKKRFGQIQPSNKSRYLSTLTLCNLASSVKLFILKSIH